jgi:hypothetical protein
MEAYSDETPLRAARDIYFRQSGLGPDGGYSAAWVRFGIGPLRLPVPNTRARRAALPLHDLHHIATGYTTSWTGEGEIAAWELAAGCASYSAAWLLNLGAFPIGFILAPRRMWRAFLRGRGSDTLYAGRWDPGWLDLSVSALQERLGLTRPLPPARVQDLLLFGTCLLPGLGGLALGWLVIRGALSG